MKIVCIVPGKCFPNPWDVGESTYTPEIATVVIRASMHKALLEHGDKVDWLPGHKVPPNVPYALSEEEHESISTCDLVYVEKRQNWTKDPADDRGFQRQQSVLDYCHEINKNVVLHDFDYADFDNKTCEFKAPQLDCKSSKIVHAGYGLVRRTDIPDVYLPVVEVHDWFKGEAAQCRIAMPLAVFVGSNYEKAIKEVLWGFQRANQLWTGADALHQFVVGGGWHGSPEGNELKEKGVTVCAKCPWPQGIMWNRIAQVTFTVGRRVHYAMGCTQHRMFEGNLLGHPIIVHPTYFNSACRKFFPNQSEVQTTLSNDEWTPNAANFLRHWNAITEKL